MKHIIIWAFIAIIFNTLPTASGATQLQCSHPELCRLAKIIAQENQVTGLEFQSLVNIAGDPHEYEPSASEVKALIKADTLVSGPHDLNPWIKKINYQRSKIPNAKTLSLALSKIDYALYPGAGHEALSHFWLYPKIFCVLKSRMENEMVNIKILGQLKNKKICLDEEKKIEQTLKETLYSLKIPIVLTHDALLPLLRSLAPTATIVAIKGSGHHQESGPEDIKRLYNALKAPKVIWLEETAINIPQTILAKKRSADLTVKLDTANSEGLQYFQVLEALNEKLKAIKI